MVGGGGHPCRASPAFAESSAPLGLRSWGVLFSAAFPISHLDTGRRSLAHETSPAALRKLGGFASLLVSRLSPTNYWCEGRVPLTRLRVDDGRERLHDTVDSGIGRSSLIGVCAGLWPECEDASELAVKDRVAGIRIRNHPHVSPAKALPQIAVLSPGDIRENGGDRGGPFLLGEAPPPRLRHRFLTRHRGVRIERGRVLEAGPVSPRSGD